MIDLGAWASDAYTIAGPEDNDGRQDAGRVESVALMSLHTADSDAIPCAPWKSAVVDR